MSPSQLSFDFFANPVITDAPVVSAETGQAIPAPDSGKAAESEKPALTRPAASQNAPIEYTTIVSARAKQVYLRVEQGLGLLVTIPKRYPKREIPALIESQREWILKSLQEIEDSTPELYRCWPPTELHFIATDERVCIDILEPVELKEGHYEIYWQSPTHLQIWVDKTCRISVASAIGLALTHRARDVLEPWLAHHAATHGLRYKRLGIRGQRTLWGSYSSSGTLSLNYKLLFLPYELVDYVLLHELAHTRFLDHSPDFWQFLDSLKPGAKALDARLSDAGPLVPPWLELAGKA